MTFVTFSFSSFLCKVRTFWLLTGLTSDDVSTAVIEEVLVRERPLMVVNDQTITKKRAVNHRGKPDRSSVNLFIFLFESKLYSVGQGGLGKTLDAPRGSGDRHRARSSGRSQQWTKCGLVVVRIDDLVKVSANNLQLSSLDNGGRQRSGEGKGVVLADTIIRGHGEACHGLIGGAGGTVCEVGVHWARRRAACLSKRGNGSEGSDG